MENERVALQFTNEIENLDKLKEYEKTLSNIKNIVSKFPKNFELNDTKTTNQINSINKSLTNTENTLNKIGVATKVAFNYTTIREFGRILKRTLSTMYSYINKSQSYLEDINLFQVAFDDNYNSAERFINKLNEMYGLDEKWLTRTVAIFKQLSNAMNLSVEQGTMLSKLMTQMSVDISSLYNVDIDRASSVLQSALAGQTKPIRGTTGADITQTTLQQTLNELGMFDKSVTNLSYAEKRLLIIVSLTRQLQESAGDWGRTLESPANQTRILKEQWERLTRTLGNVFLPIMSKILPYLNAILMVMTEILSVVATLFGYNSNDFDYFTGVADSVLELEDGLENASESANKLRNGLRAFDKINNITTPTTSGGTTVSGGTGAIDPKLWGAFSSAYDEYFKKLDNVQMKATKIRDAIMETLGFQKEINPLTGDISFKYLGWQTTVKNLWNWFKKLSPQAKILTGLIATLITKGTIKLLTSFVKLLGKTGLYGIITKLISPFKSLYKIFNNVNYSMISMSESLEIGLYEWSKSLSLLDRLKVTLVGAGGLYFSLELVKNAMKDVNEQNELTTTGFLKLSAGIAGATASGAIIGSQFGVWGAVIGAVAGATISLYNAFMEAPTSTSVLINELDKLDEKEKNFLQSIDDTTNAIQEQLNANLVQTGVHNNLLNELDKIVDKNGKVKEGYEDRAKFILNELSQAYGVEYKITDNIIENYNEYIQKIRDLIKAKEAEYILEANREAYLNALQTESRLFDYMVEAEEKLKKAKEEQKEVQKSYNKEVEKYQRMISGEDGVYATYDIEQQRLAMKKLEKQYNEINGKVKQYQDTYTEATNKYKDNILIQEKYSNLQESVLTGNLEKIEEEVEKYTNSYLENGELIVDNEEKRNKRLAEKWSILLENYKDTNDKMYQMTLDELTRETKAVEDITPEQVEKWRVLAQKDEEAFIQEFSKLDKDVQQKVVDKMYDKGYNIAQEIQNGINDFPTPTAEIEAKLKEKELKATLDIDKSKAEQKTQSFWDKLRNAWNNSILTSWFPNIPVLRFAEGGLPPVGQLFVANERGAELVGNIGGQSFVANQNQVVDLLDRKLANANTGIQNATFIVKVGDEKIGQVVLNDLEKMAKSNGKVFNIGV